MELICLRKFNMIEFLEETHYHLRKKKSERRETELRAPDWIHIIKAACHHVLQPRRLSFCLTVWECQLCQATHLSHPINMSDQSARKRREKPVDNKVDNKTSLGRQIQFSWLICGLLGSRFWWWSCVTSHWHGNISNPPNSRWYFTVWEPASLIIIFLWH